MKNEYSASQMIAAAFSLTETIPDKQGICGICGIYGEIVKAERVIKSNTADIADTFRFGNSACLSCAACFAESRLLTSNIYVDHHGLALKPMVAQSSSTQERPSWRDLVRQLEVGTKTVAIFTSNTKRRLWLNAVVGTVGDAWRVLMVDGKTERLLSIKYSKLLEQLAYIELLLEEGFNKRTIASNLLLAAKSPSELRIVMQKEAYIAPLRTTDEFLLALFISQKG